MWFNTKPLEASLNGGENRREHEVLCKFVALTDATPVLPPEPQTGEDDYRLIQALNLSTSPDDWQSMLYENKADKKVHDTPEKAGKTDRGFEGDWADWKQAAQDILADSGYAKIHELKLQELKPFQKEEASKAIKAIAEQAKHLRTEFASLTAEEKALTPDQVQKKLKIAAFGTADRGGATLTLTDVFGTDPGSSTDRQTVCEAGKTNPGPNTVVATLSCICTKALTSATAPTNPACDKQADGTSGWNAQSASNQPPVADVQALAKSCGKGTGTVTAESIRQAIEDVQHLVRIDGDDGYIGARLTGNCDGGSASGICVKLTGYTAQPTSSINKLQWISDLRQLAAALKNRQSKHTANQNKAAELKRAATQAVQIAKEAKSLTISAINTKQAAGAPEAQPPSKETCAAHTTNTTCKSPCQWTSNTEKTGNYCKTKAETENTAGKGEAAKEGATTGCARHKTKEPCENDKTGARTIAHLER
uniref:Variant surface glycoprotein 1125.2521 n=1 Tax=Trypanosoma brucei TaxID=5691 RepID=A0A1J0R4Z3_9TRYP|nr:variant surface glycoprotein 1125.2521 [Trypanosoma brucei]